MPKVSRSRYKQRITLHNLKKNSQKHNQQKIQATKPYYAYINYQLDW